MTSLVQRAATALALFSLFLMIPLAARSDPATLTVDVSRPGPAVSPLLYGIFFEEINHAGDGGLYAELVENRSFDEGRENAPRSWTLATTGGAQATIALDTSRPLNAANPRALRLDIAGAGSGGLAKVINDGYWGVPVKQGEKYNLSLYARRDATFAGPLRVRLEGGNGTVYAEAKTGALTTDWKRHALVLRANADDAKAHLVIAAERPGAIWLDVVSLFPEKTWKGRPGGLRPDLAEKLAALKPGFLRFPGGCFVEGEVLANAWRWKETLGPIETRPGRSNLWGYRSTDGLGYHEYLQLCEDLGAEPLFVVNCGMAHRDIAPRAEIARYVQDALDAIEYANGPVTSPWGALRAKNGHPKPFGLEYMEVGNENGGPAYNERYARFYDAIRSRYPYVKIIANVWGGVPESRPKPLIDEHYYNTPGWFYANANRYDRYDRGGSKVYVGEYAVTQNAGEGNLGAALGEAAFMMGMERNSDHVVMASYAPIFVNVQDRKWNPDMIVFDGVRSYGTPSYHVQRLFGENRPDVVLATTATTGPPKTRPAERGGIGVATWNTQAEFRDLKVTRGDATLYAPDLARDGTTDWRIGRGDWKVEEGALRQTGEGTDLRALAGDPNWSDYTLSLRARKIGGSEGFLILFRARDEGHWYWWNLGGWNNTRHAVERTVGGAKATVSSEVEGRIETGRWYDIKIELEGARIRCYLDGKLIHDFEERDPASFHAVAGRKGRDQIIVKVVNGSDTPQETAVTLAGVKGIAGTGTAITLAGSGAADENTLDQPTKIAPVPQTLRGLGPNFRHTFPPHSLTILRLRETR